MQRAMGGSLSYGPKSDVLQMRIAPLVLEIRLGRRLDTTQGEKLVRLYFSEPAHEEGMLLAARLGWKNPAAVAEQDAHALDAQERVLDHFA